MKRFRILAATLLIIVLGTSAAFADIAPSPIVRALPWIIYCIPVVVIIVAIVLLRAMIKKRRLKNDGIQPEEPNDINMR